MSTGTISIWSIISYDGFRMHILRHFSTLWKILTQFCMKNHAKEVTAQPCLLNYVHQIYFGAAQTVKYWTVLKICRSKYFYWNIKLYLQQIFPYNDKNKISECTDFMDFFDRMYYSLRHYYVSGNRCYNLTNISYNMFKIPFVSTAWCALL